MQQGQTVGVELDLIQVPEMGAVGQVANDGATDIVALGSEITIVEEGSDEEETYTIVGAAEARPSEGKISNESPIGGAMLGRKKGEKVKVKTPAGETVFKIKKIK